MALDETRADYWNNLATVVGATGAKPEIFELYSKVRSAAHAAG